jgi:hypothetical protein
MDARAWLCDQAHPGLIDLRLYFSGIVLGVDFARASAKTANESFALVIQGDGVADRVQGEDVSLMGHSKQGQIHRERHGA